MACTIRCRYQINTTAGSGDVLPNQQLTGPSRGAYYLKQSLVNAGWVVYWNTDGITAPSATDQWTSNTFQGAVFQTYQDTDNTLRTIDGIWCCLRSPNKDSNGNYIHICLSPRIGSWKNLSNIGTTNNLSGYGIYSGKSDAAAFNGYYSGVLLIGLALSSSETAFSGGVQYISTNSTTARGTRPIADNMIWVSTIMGIGYYSNGLTHLTVITDGNQFHVILDDGSNTREGRYWYSLCDMTNGGYALLQSGICATSSTIIASINLAGGYYAVPESAHDSKLYPYITYYGTWRTVWIKQINGAIYSGGLDKPEPPGWNLSITRPYYSNLITYPYTTYLRAINCSNPDCEADLGPISDFMLFGDTLLNDIDMIQDTANEKSWFCFKERQAYLLKWDNNDNPSQRAMIIPS